MGSVSSATPAVYNNFIIGKEAKKLGLYKSFLIDLEAYGESYGDRGQAASGLNDLTKRLLREKRKSDLFCKGKERDPKRSLRLSEIGHSSNSLYAVVHLRSESGEFYVEPLGSAGSADPLHQRGSVGKELAHVKSSLIDLEAYGESYGDRGEPTWDAERLSEKTPYGETKVWTLL